MSGLQRIGVIGGGAYVAGKRSAQRQMDSQMDMGSMDQGPMYQGSMYEGPDAGQGMPPAPVSSAPSVSDQLAQLSSLHQQGSLSDAEFAAAKARLLGR